MTAPAGVVDLSLPDYATLVARAGVNPDAEAARVASAAPADVRGAGTAFGRAGGELDSAFTASMGAQGSIGAAFTNGGAPVLDRGTHVANLPAGFGDAGTRLAWTSGRLTAVAEDLAATMRETSTAVTELHGELQQTRSSWAARVAAAGTLPDGSGGGLIPQEAIPGLLAERDRIAVGMATRVGAVGREVVGRIGTYETVINDAVRLLADHGFVPPAERDAGTPPAPVVEYGGGADPSGYGTPLLAGYAADPVNTALGNFVEVETDVAFGGLLAGLSFARTYNSRSDRVGAFGPGWSSWASTRLVEGTWTAEFEGPDGQRVAFPRTGTGFGRAVGIDALVERAGSGLVLAWFDGRRWEFDATGRLERTWAGPGTAVRFGHDDEGRLVELVHERGRRLVLEWDGDRIVAASASDGRRVAYRYDQGLLAEADGPAGARRYGSDGAGRVASATDADGVVELVNTYDDQGRVLTQRSPFGRLVTFSYGSDGTTVVADDSASPTNVYRHDRAGRLVAVTDGHGHTLRKRYDPWGNPVEIVERGGGVTRQEFDDRGHLVRRTTPAGAVFTVSWDDADRVVTVTAAGAQTRFTYSGVERTPSEIVDPEGGVTRLQVLGGLVAAVTDPDGVTVRLRHDGDGHLVEAVDAAGGVARIERDRAGLPVAVVTPAGRRTEVVHDGHGRPVQRRDPAGAVWRHEYTAAGRLAATTDPTGARTETRYGPHGEAVELVDALGAVTTQGYDVFGNLADLTEAGRGEVGVPARRAVAVDGVDRPVRGHLVAGTTTSTAARRWRPTPAGCAPGPPTTRTVGPPSSTTDWWSPASCTTRWAGSSPSTAPTAPPARSATTGAVGWSPRPGPTAGSPATPTARPGACARSWHRPAAPQRYLHDDRGRLTARVDGAGHRFELRHDPDGLLVERTSPTGLVETLDRDDCGRVTRHRIPGRGTTVYGYDPAGRVVAVTDRYGRREFTRDPAGRIVAATDALGHTTGYAYDRRGHLVEVTDPLGGVTHYAHDECGRVSAVTDPLGRTTRYVRDEAGRVREQHDPTGARRRVTHDPSGRPSAVTATADGAEHDDPGRAGHARPAHPHHRDAAAGRDDRAALGRGRAARRAPGRRHHRRLVLRPRRPSHRADPPRRHRDLLPPRRRRPRRRPGAPRVRAAGPAARPGRPAARPDRPGPGGPLELRRRWPHRPRAARAAKPDDSADPADPRRVRPRRRRRHRRPHPPVRLRPRRAAREHRRHDR